MPASTEITTGMTRKMTPETIVKATGELSQEKARERVVVGLSGGVDSSAAASILHHQGYDVVGLTLWLMKGKGQCCSEGMVDAAIICEQLGIPHHIVDTRELFQSQVVDYLLEGYKTGITPLPCSACNKAVKFPPMLQFAREQLGVDKVATGHYARIAQDPQTGRYQLLRAVDRGKDQSYFLFDLSQDILAHVLFPLGNQSKQETRAIAERHGLSTAQKPDSQDLCLVEKFGSMREFLNAHIDGQMGEIVDLNGQVLGYHTGVHQYTIGQRKGLGVSSAYPLYVAALDVENNRVVLGDRASVHRLECTVAHVNWVSMTAAIAPLRAEVQVRYRTPEVPVTVIPLDDQRVRLVFDEPQFGITPGQAAVWYDGNLVLAGGYIEP